MIESIIKDAFGIDDEAQLQQLSTGLINQTYKVSNKDGKGFLLQKINKRVFGNPFLIQANYIRIEQHLKNKNSFRLPGIILANGKDLILEYNDSIWRCFEFIPDTYSPAVSSGPDEAWLVANCFGKFSAALSDLNPNDLKIVLPGFHDLALRFAQFEKALEYAGGSRKNSSKQLIEYAYQNKYLVDFYDAIVKDSLNFRQYILHHDCKIANILFKSNTHEVYCPIDLDTTQPGLYFSDLGDMIRSITPNFSENGTAVDELVLRTDFYLAVKEGYLAAMAQSLTKEELKQIDMSGKLMVYMQAIRFLTDYLNGDVYYRIEYPEQNRNRAANQFKLLFLLDDYIKSISDKRIFV